MNQSFWAGHKSTLDAARDVPGTIDLCSSRVGWQSLLLRRYVAQKDLDAYLVPPITDQRIVMFERAGDNAGRPNAEVLNGRNWIRANYADGDLSMLGANRERCLRWHTLTPHVMVHLYVPAGTLASVAQETSDQFDSDVLTRTCRHDPTVTAVVLALERAIEQGYGEGYADSAAHFLAVHIVQANGVTFRRAERNTAALRKIDEMLREQLATNITNADLASVVGRTTFQLIRMCQAAWGETPMQRLTRLRMERGRQLLQQTSDSIIEVALQCGYENPSHFATAFKRATGMSPSRYRAG